MRKKILAGVGAAAVAALVTTAVVQPGQAQKDWRSGTITLNTKSVGFILGGQWGGGTLRYRGRFYKVRVRVFEAGVIGAQAATFNGVVYNMRRLSDIEGTYVAGGAAGTAVVGKSIVSLQNSKGVKMTLRGNSVGLAAKIAAKGFNLRLAR